MAWKCGLRREQVMVGPVIGRDLFFLRDLSAESRARSIAEDPTRGAAVTPFQLGHMACRPGR